MTLIVLEGCDGAGKSSLAEALLTYTGGVIVHKGPPTEDAFSEYMDIPYPYMGAEIGDIVILDRWHLGEMIYGPKYRGVSQITMEQARDIDRVLDIYGAIKLHLDAPDDILEARAFERGEDFIKAEDIKDIAYQYRLLCQQLRWWRTVHTNRTKPAELAARILGVDD